MRTLFLGSYGFGNLGDELCLIEAVSHFKSSSATAFSVSPEYTRRSTGVSSFIRYRHEIANLCPERVILGGGGVGFWPSLRDSLHWMHDAIELGATAHIHNIGVAKIQQIEWFNDAIVRKVLSKLKSFTVRDHVSRWQVTEWGFGLNPGITLYPERLLPADPSLDLKLEAGVAIGISITGQSAMLDALELNRDKISRFISTLGDFVVVPIISTVSDQDANEDDIAGFNRFADMFLKQRQIVCKEMLQQEWRREHLTPRRLKYVISRLKLLVSQRKHNIIHAIGSGVPFVGIFPDADDSIMRIIFSLRNEIPFGSGFLSLNTSRYKK